MLLLVNVFTLVNTKQHQTTPNNTKTRFYLRGIIGSNSAVDYIMRVIWIKIQNFHIFAQSDPLLFGNRIHINISLVDVASDFVHRKLGSSKFQFNVKMLLT